MKKKYSGLEIICLGKNKTKTGEHAKVLLNGEEVHHKWGIRSLTWDINPDKSIIKINYCHDMKTGKVIGVKNDETIEKQLRITYPIKRIELDYKLFSVLSNNTPIGTQFFLGDKNITSKSGISEFHAYIGNSNEINEFELISC